MQNMRVQVVAVVPVSVVAAPVKVVCVGETSLSLACSTHCLPPPFSLLASISHSISSDLREER